jgi:pyridoxal phosphate enzyme (YggS family)
MDSVIEKNIKSIKEKVEKAAGKSGQKEEEIKLVAVTKNVPITQIETAIEAGITDIGENKVQEALNKFRQLEKKITRHFVGHLQRNKVKQIVGFVDLIQSVDSLRLAEEIDKRAREKNKVQNILVQVNIAEEETKFGLRKKDIKSFLKEISNFKNLKVKGLMTIAPLVSDPKEVYPIFVEMKRLFEDLKRDKIPGIEMEYLSMGMTNDFEVAIEAGANMIRIGTGIFGDVR